jgi:hypothetical protein
MLVFKLLLLAGEFDCLLAYNFGLYQNSTCRNGGKLGNICGVSQMAMYFSMHEHAHLT